MRDIKQAMNDYLPHYYREIREVEEMIQVESRMIEGLTDDLADLLAQYSVETATWGLKYWERLVGVTTDESKPIEERRSVVRSKLRGVGTVTVELIKNVAESFDFGNVEIEERSSEYTIIVKYVSMMGVPPNLADIEKALRDIIPAHLAINFIFKFVLYNRVKTVFSNYGDLAANVSNYSQLLEYDE